MVGTERRSSLLRGCNVVLVNSRRFIRGLRRRPVAVLYPGDKHETLIKPPEQNKQREHDPKAQKKRPDKTDAQRLKEKPTDSGVGKSSGNLPRVMVKNQSVREQLDGMRFDTALPGDKRLA